MKDYPAWVVESGEWWIRASDMEAWREEEHKADHNGLRMDLRKLRKATEEWKERVPEGYHHVLKEISVAEILLKGKADNWTKGQYLGLARPTGHGP